MAAPTPAPLHLLPGWLRWWKLLKTALVLPALEGATGGEVPDNAVPAAAPGGWLEMVLLTIAFVLPALKGEAGQGVPHKAAPAPAPGG